jgi:hypothetical protein
VQAKQLGVPDNDLGSLAQVVGKRVFLRHFILV